MHSLWPFRLLAFLLAAILPLSAPPGASTPAHSAQTGLAYQALDGYKAAVIPADFVTAPQAQKWLDTIAPAENAAGYYAFILSDPASWQMLLYWPAAHIPAGSAPSPDTLRFSLADGAIHLALDASQAFPPQDLLILIQAPPRGPWPTTVTLHVDTTEIPLAAMDYAT